MRERSAAQSLFAGPWRPKQEGDEKTTRAWFSTPRAPSSGRAIPHLMPSLIQEAASRGGGIHPEGQRRQTLTSRRRLRAHHRLAQERAASWGIMRNGHHRTRTWPPRWTGRRDQVGKPAQCGRQTGRPTSTSNTTSSTRRSRAHRERRGSLIGRGDMAGTATTTPPTTAQN